MKRDSDGLEVIPPGDGGGLSVTVATVQGLSSPPMKKACLDGAPGPGSGPGPEVLSTSGLSSPPMKSPAGVGYGTGSASGGAEVADGGASPQPAAEAEEKDDVADMTPTTCTGGRQFPCVWLNGAGGIDTSPTKPAYDVMPLVSNAFQHLIAPKSHITCHRHAPPPVN